jgi:hypothetical protein
MGPASGDVFHREKVCGEPPVSTPISQFEQEDTTMHGTIRCRCILGPVIVACAIISSAAEDREMPRPIGLKSVPAYTTLPDQAIGVIVLEPQPVLAYQHQIGPKDAACFSSGACSYRFFYVPAKEGSGVTQSFNVAAPEQGKISIDGLTLATSRTLRPEITEPYTLARVVVNRGAGCGPKSTFAATELKPLGPRDGYPIRVTETVREHEARYRRDLIPSLLRGELAKARHELAP